MDQAELERELTCRQRVSRWLSGPPLLRDYNLDELADRAMWVSDDFEVGIEIACEAQVPADVLERILRNIRIHVLDLREVGVCVAEASSG